MFLHSYIFNDNKNVCKFIKKTLNEKNVYAFLIKKTFTNWLGSKQQNFQQLPSKATYQKELHFVV